MTSFQCHVPSERCMLPEQDVQEETKDSKESVLALNAPQGIPIISVRSVRIRSRDRI